MKAYTIGLYEKAMPKELTWKEKLEAAKQAGYDFVEISIDETDEKLARLEWTKEERLELVKTMYEVGIPVRTMCLSGHRKYPIGSSDPEICKRGMEIMEKAIELADSGKVQLKPLISQRFPFQKYLEAYKYIDENRETTMKVLIDVQK